MILQKGLENLEEAKKVREAVFVIEQGYDEEFDEIDEIAWHVLILDNQQGIAVGRTYQDNHDSQLFHIGRMAVLKEYRKQSLGRLIMSNLEKQAKRLGAKTMKLSAQQHAIGFYQSMGYQVISEVYLDQGQPHVSMKKTI